MVPSFLVWKSMLTLHLCEFRGWAFWCYQCRSVLCVSVRSKAMMKAALISWKGWRNSSGQPQSFIQGHQKEKDIEGYGLQQQLSLVLFHPQISSLSTKIRLRDFKNSWLWMLISLLLLRNHHNFELEKKIWKGVIWLQRHCQRMSFLKHGSRNKMSETEYTSNTLGWVKNTRAKRIPI